MMQTSPESGRRRNLTARGFIIFALLASVVGVGAAVLFDDPGGIVNSLSPARALAAPQPQTRLVQRLPSFTPLVKSVRPAVVSVRVRMKPQIATTSSSNDQNGQQGIPPQLRRFFRQFGFPQFQRPQHYFTEAEGSGFFISADGYIVTNNHVVKDAKSVQVTMEDGKTLKAKIIGTDPKTDLALLKVNGDHFPYVQLSDHNPRVGDWVVVVGNPFGLGGTVTAGIVSANGRAIGDGPYDNFIQIDAPVNHGNSGGPAFNVNGKVIGVTTAIYSPSGGSVGIGFAIPAETVKYVVNQLRDHGHVVRGWLGVQVQRVTREIADSLGMKAPHGALVAEPMSDSPAAKAGIKPGDVIVSVNGKAVKDARDLAQTIALINPGTSVQIGILRNGKRQTKTVLLGTFPNNKEMAELEKHNEPATREPHALGLTMAPASSVSGAGDEGVVVTNVNPNGPAAEHGFRAGEVIFDVGGKSVSTPAQVRRQIARARLQGKRAVLMRIHSNGNTRFVALPVGNG